VAFVTEALTPSHQREGFDCGEPALNEYLRFAHLGRLATYPSERGRGLGEVLLRGEDWSRPGRNWQLSSTS